MLLAVPGSYARLSQAAMFNSPAQCNGYVGNLANQVTDFKSYAWFEFFARAQTSSTSVNGVRYVNTGTGTIPRLGACGLFFPGVPDKFRQKILANLNLQIAAYNASGHVKPNIDSNYGLECQGGVVAPLSTCTLLSAPSP
jgi:hypothetical protein